MRFYSKRILILVCMHYQMKVGVSGGETWRYMIVYETTELPESIFLKQMQFLIDHK